MGRPRQANCDDFDTPEERRDFALNLKEGLDPQGAFEDFGDLDSDDRAISEDRDDIHCSTADEIETYYDELGPSGVTLK